jgi:membrane protein
MDIKTKIKKVQDFIKKDLWFLDIEQHVSGAGKFFINELRMAVLVIKLSDKNFILSRASALAFTTLLSLIPVLAILFMFFKAFGGNLVETKIKPMIYEYLTAGMGDSISGYIDSFLGSATVDTLGSIGFIFLLGAVYSILSSIESSFNAIFQVRKNRNPVEMLKTYLTIIFVAPVLMIMSLWLTSRLEYYIRSSEILGGLFSFMMFYLTPYILMILMFLFLIVIIPNTKVKFLNALVGAVAGAVSMILLKALFIHYTKLVVSYNVIYGSIAAVPFFMLWLYFSWIVVLVSVQITYVRQNVHNLTHIEQNLLSNRVDRTRIALMVIIKIAKNFIAGKEQSSKLEISRELDIPVLEITECLHHLEQSGLIVEIAKKHESYTLNLPLESLTIGRITDTVDLMFIENKNFKSEKNFKEISKIISDNRIIADKDALLTSFLEK